MRYQKIHSQIWHDEKFIHLSGEAQRLFLYLLSSPHSNSIGLYVINKMYICADLQITIQQLKKPFDSLIEVGLIIYDEKVNLLLIVNHLKHNKIENKGQAEGAAKIVATLPKSYIIQDVITQLPKHYHRPLVTALRGLYATPEEKEKEKEKEKTEEKEEKISCNDIVQGWNEICSKKGFPKVERLTPDRRSKINSRLKIHKDVEFWNKVFNKIIRTPFLMGKNDRKWRVTFDWLFANDENSTKIFEGNYEQDRK